MNLTFPMAVTNAEIIGDYSLNNFPNTKGFTMSFGGRAVRNAGDVNGDGVDDIIVGSYWENSNAGMTHVVFGKKNTVLSDFSLIGFVTGPTTGFHIRGAAASDYNGYSVGKAGDVNGDGIDDIITASFAADVAPRTDAGICYVMFGRRVTVAANNAFADIQLNTDPLAANIGFRILGSATNDHNGEFVREITSPVLIVETQLVSPSISFSFCLLYGMTLNHNLQEQLRFLQENLSECHFAGFQYASTASENIEVQAMNSRNCLKQSVSDAGYLVLQTFRTKQSSANTTNNEASQLLRVPITSNSTRSKYTTPVSAPIAPRKKTLYNLQDESRIVCLWTLILTR